MRDFSGRVAVITGGASGIGRALGQALGKEGARVVLLDIEQAALDGTVKALRADGITVSGLVADVVKPEAMNAVADLIFAEQGRVHLLFNNAGVGLGEAQRRIWDLPLADWQWGCAVNVMGVVNGIRAFVPRMLASGEDGVIVNTSSSNGGLVPLPTTPIYAATKAAVTALTEVLHQQFLMEKARLRAALLYPGPFVVDTNILTSARNRQAEFPADGGSKPALYHSLRELAEKSGVGMRFTAPQEVAQHALSGLRQGRFWIIPDNPDADARVMARANGIVRRENPAAAGQ
jgi:NAD(P)-dependent dehydrogenase (short-subunit alcohol dehydrogenase family)